MSRVSGWAILAVFAGYAVFVGSGLFAGAALAGGKDSSPGGTRVQVPTDGASIAAGGKLFRTYCVPCHGVSGRGDGPTAAALNPKPRNFTHPKEFKSKNDDEILAVITRGGAAAKLSPVMPAWGTTLKRAQILQLIAFVHSLAPPDSGAARAAPPATPGTAK